MSRILFQRQTNAQSKNANVALYIFAVATPKVSRTCVRLVKVITGLIKRATKYAKVADVIL